MTKTGIVYIPSVPPEPISCDNVMLDPETFEYICLDPGKEGLSLGYEWFNDSELENEAEYRAMTNFLVSSNSKHYIALGKRSEEVLEVLNELFGDSEEGKMVYNDWSNMFRVHLKKPAENFRAFAVGYILARDGVERIYSVARRKYDVKPSQFLVLTKSYNHYCELFGREPRTSYRFNTFRGGQQLKSQVVGNMAKRSKSKNKKSKVKKAESQPQVIISNPQEEKQPVVIDLTKGNETKLEEPKPIITNTETSETKEEEPKKKAKKTRKGKRPKKNEEPITITVEDIDEEIVDGPFKNWLEDQDYSKNYIQRVRYVLKLYKRKGDVPKHFKVNLKSALRLYQKYLGKQ